MNTSCERPRQVQEGQLSTQLEVLNKVVSALHDTIGEIESMLSPFSRQDAKENCAEEAPCQDTVTPMVDRIKTLVEITKNADTRIRTIMELLEL